MKLEADMQTNRTVNNDRRIRKASILECKRRNRVDGVGARAGADVLPSIT
jgi:hypothetical protein